MQTKWTQNIYYQAMKSKLNKIQFEKLIQKGGMCNSHVMFVVPDLCAQNYLVLTCALLIVIGNSNS